MRNKLLSDYFFEAAKRYRDRFALTANDQCIRYGQLELRVARITGVLETLYSGDGALAIGLMIEKSIDCYAALLAILHTGNVYVPIPPDVPSSRQSFIANDAGISILIINSSSLDVFKQRNPLADDSLLLLCLDSVDYSGNGLYSEKHTLVTLAELEIAAKKTNIKAEELKYERLAYILYTSGTTGNPKGVPVSHASGRACIENVIQLFNLTERDVWTQFAHLSFDISIGEMFSCWGSGGHLVVPNKQENLSLRSFVQKHQITVWSSVPSRVLAMDKLHQLQENSFPSIRISFFCGEALTSKIVEKWQYAAVNSKNYNIYGPTEAAIFCTSYLCSDPLRNQGTIPIGSGFEGVEVLVVDENETKVGPEVVGELLLSGIQVSDSYWNNPYLSKQCFTELQAYPNVSWYKTGDLCWVSEDGTLNYAGRKDRQVKKNGYRVELIEIENAILQTGLVDYVAVVFLTADHGVFDTIVAFTNKHSVELEQNLSEKLHHYMLPAKYLELQQFPLNSNGKIDYAILTRLACESLREYEKM